jgi:hypothetical protein
MEVLGRDSIRGAYRVAVDTPEGRLIGLVPDATISAAGLLTGGHGHATAYEWLARHSNGIKRTLRTLQAGGRITRAPFDRVLLERE